MNITADENAVALLGATRYDRPIIKGLIERLCSALDFKIKLGDKVMLKPNLVSAGSCDGLACTSPEFVAAAAEWFIDHGAEVMIGDSPAFGSAKKVMRACGMLALLKGLPVQIKKFRSVHKRVLASGFQVGIAQEALDCDYLINLPRVKTHGQLLITLAVKNYFGCVVGWRKALIHLRHGDIGNHFEALQVDLLDVLPTGITLLDGIIAMQGDGPINGKPYPLELVGASLNPVALDTVILAILGIAPSMSPLWRETKRRNLPGSDLSAISLPLQKLQDWQVQNFHINDELKPITFHPGRMLVGGIKRLLAVG